MRDVYGWVTTRRRAAGVACPTPDPSICFSLTSMSPQYGVVLD
jgi:hypothetical protein